LARLSLAATWRLPLASIEVQAASWLAPRAMHYRLAYAEPLRRQSYGESRWAAPPAELLETCSGATMLRRARKCSGRRLSPAALVLDELEQRFDSPQSSQVRIELQAVLLPAHGSDMLARRAFRWKGRRPAPMPGGAVRGPRARRFWRWLTKLPPGPMIWRATDRWSSSAAETEPRHQGPNA
jgi:hypothetical protein